MTISITFSQFKARNKKWIAPSLTAALVMGCVMPVLAAGQPPSNPLLSQAQDVGPVDAAMPMTATVWLKGHNESALGAAVAERYEPSSPNYHRWMSPREVAGFGPTMQDVATVQASLGALGLKIDKISENGTAIKVSGTAQRMQAAFHTTVHQFRQLNANGKAFYATTTKPQYQGAHAELIGTVSGLTNRGMQTFVLRQMDLSTGEQVPRVTADQAGANPLSFFTANCFGPAMTANLSGIPLILSPRGPVTDTFTGPSYLDPTTTSRPSCGYTAKQLAAHYGLDEVYARGWTGKGETIVIVDAYGSPTAQADVNTFSQLMGLPAMNDSSFRVVYPSGQPLTADNGWALETTLDVEWAHAMAPDANIVLVVAPSAENGDLAYAVDYAVTNHLGNVISNSWGLPEAYATAGDAKIFDDVFKRAAAQGISVNVATGDSGDNGVGSPVGAAVIPASSPYATGVGGTSIGVPSDHGPVEAAWGISVTHLGPILHPYSEPVFSGFIQGSGGGESVFLEKPSYQRRLPGTGRQLPDVSALGDPQTGGIVVETLPNGQTGYGVIGGTSLATPIFSAIWALANQAAGESLGHAAPAIAALPAAALRDILPIAARKDNTSGTLTYNTATISYNPAQLLGLSQTQPTGFVSTLVLAGRAPYLGWNAVGFGTDSSLRAAQGWDNATGYGVPNGVSFIEAAKRLSRRGGL
jgi:subtilase family serine protease